MTIEKRSPVFTLRDGFKRIRDPQETFPERINDLILDLDSSIKHWLRNLSKRIWPTLF